MNRITTIAVLIPLAAGLLAAGSMDPVYLDSSKSKSTKSDGAKASPKPGKANAGKAAVEADVKNHRVTIDGHFTGTIGSLELGACTKAGKTYLAPLCLAAKPSSIAAAMRKIGAEPGEVPVADRQRGTATEPTGPGVNLIVQWHETKENDVVLRRVALEELFWNRTAEGVMAKGPWIYAGSKVVRSGTDGTGLFVADLSGTVAAVTRLDTGALFYYGGMSPKGDVWSAKAKATPPKGTACRLIVELVPKAKPKTTAPAKTEDGGDKPDEKATPEESQPEKTGPTATPAETEKKPEPGEPKADPTAPQVVP